MLWRYIKHCSVKLVLLLCILGILANIFGNYWTIFKGNEDFVEDVAQDQMEAEVEFTNISTIRHYMRKGCISYNYSVADIEPETSWAVPSVLHFIWLGDFIPEKYINNILSFITNNKHCQVNLWTNENSANNEAVQLIVEKNSNFAALDIESTLNWQVNRKIITEETNLGAKSDLLRYEIIYHFGGIYVDVDSISISRFPTDFRHSFVSHTFEPNNNIQCSIFGFPKNSKFLKFVLSHVQTNARLSQENDWPVPLRYGPPFLTTMFVLYNDNKVHMIDQDYLVLLTNKSITFQVLTV